MRPSRLEFPVTSSRASASQAQSSTRCGAQLPGDFTFPRNISDIEGPFSALPQLAVGVQQAKAAASLIVELPGQLAATAGTALEDSRNWPGHAAITLAAALFVWEYWNGDSGCRCCR